MTDRLLIALVLGFVGWNGLLPIKPPMTLHDRMVQQQHAKVCAKKKLKPKIKELCKEWT